MPRECPVLSRGKKIGTRVARPVAMLHELLGDQVHHWVLAEPLHFRSALCVRAPRGRNRQGNSEVEHWLMPHPFSGVKASYQQVFE